MEREDDRLVRASLLIIPLTALLVVGVALAPAPGSDDERARIAALMGVREGSVVADVGAGDGRFAWDLATRVGDAGRVYATEIDAGDVRRMRDRVASRELGNVSVVLGTGTATGLPDGCCDAILLRRVYHHFSDPPAMVAALSARCGPTGCC